MLIRLSDPAHLGDLVSYLQAAECLAEQAGSDLIRVSVPRALDERQARREVALYLAAWRAMHPDVEAELLD